MFIRIFVFVLVGAQLPQATNPHLFYVKDFSNSPTYQDLPLIQDLRSEVVKDNSACLRNS